MGRVQEASDIPASGVTLAIEGVLARIAHEGHLAPVSLLRNSDLIRTFGAFLICTPTDDIADVTPAIAETFIRSLTRSGRDPSIATMRLRRSALRSLFREAQALGLTDTDPTYTVMLPSRSCATSRPLTDSEIHRCRSFAESMPGDSRFAAAWALAEATTRVPELGAIRRRDVHDSVCSLPGSSSTEQRRVAPTDWGVVQLARHLSSTPGDDASLLLGTGIRGSLHELIAGTLSRAGLARKTGVTPNSVAAWPGAREMEGGSTIDQVARLLGMRSLDRTAKFIGFHWRELA